MKHPAHPLYKTALLAALTACLVAVPAAAKSKYEGVTLFEDVHFGGRYATFDGDVPDLGKTYLGNDCASSIAVPRGCQVTLYRDAYFRGPAVTVDHKVADLGYTRLGNDEVSSLSVSCYGDRRGYDRYRYDENRYEDHRYDDRYRNNEYNERHYDRGRYGEGRSSVRERHFRGVTVYSNAGFRGRYESFRYDDADLRDNPIRQDTISSIAVSRGCRAVLYEDVGFRGNRMVLNGDAADLRYSAVGNDRVSSIRVDCRGH